MKLVDYLQKYSLSQAQFARMCGRTQGAVSHWITGHISCISAESALAIAVATNDEVPAHELRPDLFEAPGSVKP